MEGVRGARYGFGLRDRAAGRRWISREQVAHSGPLGATSALGDAGLTSVTRPAGGTEGALRRPRLPDDVSIEGQLLQWQLTVEHRRGEVVEVAPEAVGVGPQERERVSTGHLETGVDDTHSLPDQGPPVGRGRIQPGRTVRAPRCRVTDRLEDRRDFAGDGA